MPGAFSRLMEEKVMPNAVIIGASGYAGAVLAELIAHHPEFRLSGLYVSENSLDAGKKLSELYPHLLGTVDDVLKPLTAENLDEAHKADAVFLCTAHKVSAELAGGFYDRGVKVFDLSGAFRVPEPEFYEKYYGFTHPRLDLLPKAVYGLAEWNHDEIAKTDLVAVAGCYPTASLTALKPLEEAGLTKSGSMPIINAVSGVTGSGRKATMTNSFCEVSLAPYGVFRHRHRPEISYHLGQKVLFQPHLGCFRRGILATIYVELAGNASDEAITAAYHRAYDGKRLVRLTDRWPSVLGVAGTPYVDVHFEREGEELIVVSAIDNLMKGASAQALQCANIRFGFSEYEGIL